MERYAKYREQIKRMAPDEFSSKKVEQEDLDSAKEATLPSFSTQEEGTKTKSGPYYLYLQRRKRWFVVKVVCFALVVVAFLVWWFLLQGRKP